MQHWTLCEVLSIAQANGVRSLNYIDAHAMAPLATVRTGSDPTFDRVCDSLPGQCSVYERAWRKLSPVGVDWYPNSANFVRQVWQGDYSLLLCEQDAGIADDIRRWLCDVKRNRGCSRTERYPGDWRCRFGLGLPPPAKVGLSQDALTFISFDPYMISRRHSGEELGNIYACDLEDIGRLTATLDGAVVTQLSTYTANGGNSQEVIAPLPDCVLGQYGFDRAAKVWADGNMMSLIYTRNVSWADKLDTLGDDFERWLAKV